MSKLKARLCLAYSETEKHYVCKQYGKQSFPSSNDEGKALAKHAKHTYPTANQGGEKTTTINQK